MEKSHIIFGALVLMLIIGVAAYFTLHSNSSVLGNEMASTTTATSTSPNAKSTATNVTASISANIESTTTPILPDEVFTNELAKSGLTNYSYIPAYAVSPIQFTTNKIGNQVVQAIYRTHGITFDVAPFKSTLVKNTINLTTDFDFAFGVNTFTYQGGQYYMFSNMYCGNQVCGHSFSMYVFKNGSLSAVGSTTPYSLFNLTVHPIVRAVLLLNGNAYIIISHFTSTTAIILDSSGNFVNTVTSTDGSPAEPAGVLPADLASLIQSIAS